jgi:hypothetical protein
MDYCVGVACNHGPSSHNTAALPSLLGLNACLPPIGVYYVSNQWYGACPVASLVKSTSSTWSRFCIPAAMSEGTVPGARHLSDLLDTASEVDCEDGVVVVAAASVVISLVRMISMEEARHEADADDDLFD